MFKSDVEHLRWDPEAFLLSKTSTASSWKLLASQIVPAGTAQR